MRNTIDSAIIDTSVLVNNQCDFLGINHSTIPAFYELLVEKGILLLDHEILHKEITKHIEDSIAVSCFRKFCNIFEKNKELLEFLKISYKSMSEQLANIDINEKVIEIFENIYRTAYKLPYPDADKIFNQYFTATAPFKKSGDKKNEFPDAFVIESIKHYIEEEEYKTVLVISNDGDWEESFRGVQNIIYVSSLDEAINLLQEEMSLAVKLFNLIKEEIKVSIANAAEHECYSIDDYDLFNDDYEIDEIKVSNLYNDIVVLKLTSDTIIMKCSAELKVKGRAVVFDEDCSIWDSEMHDYIHKVYSEVEFENALADIDCELEINYDLYEIGNSATINKVKIVNPYAISLSLVDAESTWEQLYEEDEY